MALDRMVTVSAQNKVSCLVIGIEEVRISHLDVPPGRIPVLGYAIALVEKRAREFQIIDLAGIGHLLVESLAEIFVTDN